MADPRPEKQNKVNPLFRWPIVRFFQSGAASGVLLIASMVVALAWANSPWSESYFELWHTYAGITVGAFGLKLSLLHWISDGLMGLFFFHVGLEIKRELMTGELSSKQKAALPVLGALGGMVVPALLYTLFNFHAVGARGWGIPMATDIAFALGVMVLMGSRVPLGIKVFLTALAIVDDLGAVLVIAIFYTRELDFMALGIGLALVIFLAVASAFGLRRRIVYLGVGILVWYCFLRSGVHSTVAWVLVSMTVPHKMLGDRMMFLRTAGESLKALETVPEDAAQHSVLEQRDVALSAIESAAERWGSPLRRLEQDLTPYVVFLIMPLFALANAGVVINWGGLLHELSDPVPMGVFVGLIVGKPIGIFAFSWLAIKTNLAKMPSKSTMRHLFAASSLGGIGFTMSLFIANLAFPGSGLLEESKVGIFFGSLISALLGTALMFMAGKPGKQYAENEVLDFSGR